MESRKFVDALNYVVISESNKLMCYEEEHVFSDDFERNMSRLIRQQRKFYYYITNTIGKKAVCFMAILLISSFATVMNVESARNTVAEFFIGIYEKFSNIVSSDDNEAPEKIEQIYSITVGIDDFDVMWEVQDDLNYEIMYLKEPHVVKYGQFVKGEYDANWNTEGAEIETLIINAYEAVYFCDNHNYHHLIWSTEEYVFTVSTNMEKEKLLEMSKSIKKIK